MITRQAVNKCIKNRKTKVNHSKPAVESLLKTEKRFYQK